MYDPVPRSAQQMKMLGQRQLDQSLHELASHPAWSSGLGLATHLGALCPGLVADIESNEAAENIKDFFGYLKNQSENPFVNPSLFQPCCLLYPGVCKSDKYWGKVVRMVQQFEIGLENNKASAAGQYLIHFEAATDFQDSSSSDGIPLLHESWYVIGCVAKRPLVHILGSLRPVQNRNNMFVPEYVHVEDQTKKHWSLHTSYAVFLFILREIFGDASDDQPLRLAIRIRFHSFDAIGSLDDPNHFRMHRDYDSEVVVGTHVLVGRNAVAVQTTKPSGSVELGFGFSFEPTKVNKPVRSRGSDPKEKELSKLPSIDNGIDKRSSDSTKERDLSKLPALDKIKIQDSAPAELDKKASQELLVVIKQLSSHEQDTEISANTSQDAKLASTSSKPTAAKSKCLNFSSRVGITDLQPAKRKMICLACNEQIHQGDYRFEHFFSMKKAPRSVHPECVGQLNPETFDSSIQWLTNSSIKRSGIEQKVIKRALEVLETAAELQRVCE
jgi:hypothetical protein